MKVFFFRKLLATKFLSNKYYTHTHTTAETNNDVNTCWPMDNSKSIPCNENIGVVNINMFKKMFQMIQYNFE